MSVTELAYRITGDAAGLSRELRGAEKDVRRMSRRAESDMRKLGRAFSIFGGIAATAMVGAIKHTIDAGEEMSLMSERTGFAVESLGRLGWAAEQSGTDIERVETSLSRFNLSLGQAADGSGEAASMARRYGIELRDRVTGELRSSEEVLLDVADAFAGIESEQEKAAMANAFFGRSYQELIPILNQGRDGLEELGDEAERLGIVMEAETAEAARRLNDNLNVMRQRGRAVALAFGENVLPVFDAYAEILADSAGNGDDLRESMGAAGSVALWFTKTIEGARAAVVVLSETLGALGGQFWTAKESGRDFATTTAEGLREMLRSMSEGDVSGARGALTNMFTGMQEDADTFFHNSGESWSGYFDDVEDILTESASRLLALDRAARDGFGASDEDDDDDSGTSGAGWRGLVDDTEKELERLESVIERQLRAVATPLEQFEEVWTDMVDALDQELISDQQFERIQEHLLETLDPFGEFAEAAERAAAEAEEALRMEGLVDAAANVRAELMGIDLRTKAHLDSLQELRDEGLLTWQEYEMAVAQVAGEIEELESVAIDHFDLMQSAAEMLGNTLIDGIVDPFNSSIEDMASNFIRQLTRMVLETVAQRAILAAFGGGAGFSGGGLVQSFSGGGYVSGPGTATSDSIPARLSDGEYVIPAHRVRQMGVGFFDAIRKGKPPGYASGGLVTRSGSGDSGGGSAGGVKVVVVDDQRRAAIEALRSPAGEQVILQTIQKRRGDF